MKNDLPLPGIEMINLFGRRACAAIPIMIEDVIVGKYQRRTQKGTGRTEKTVHSGAAKNPRLLKACNITKYCDMGEFFFISVLDENVVNVFTTQRKTFF
jgi:hypothetical protein